MKNLLFCAMLVFGISIPAHASIVVQPTMSPDGLFTLSTDSINRLKNSDEVRFDLSVDQATTSAISSWKIRLTCDDLLSVKVATSTTNNCGTAVSIPVSKLGAFSLYFENESSQIQSFKVALKAYDSMGKWLETEKVNFKWK